LPRLKPVKMVFFQLKGGRSKFLFLLRKTRETLALDDACRGPEKVLPATGERSEKKKKKGTPLLPERTSPTRGGKKIWDGRSSVYYWGGRKAYEKDVLWGDEGRAPIRFKIS